MNIQPFSADFIEIYYFLFLTLKSSRKKKQQFRSTLPNTNGGWQPVNKFSPPGWLLLHISAMSLALFFSPFLFCSFQLSTVSWLDRWKLMTHVQAFISGSVFWGRPKLRQKVLANMIFKPLTNCSKHSLFLSFGIYIFFFLLNYS